MATWSGSIGPGTDPGTGRSIYLDWTIYSDVDPGFSTTSVAFRLVIYVRTGGQSIDSSNSFTISGDWSRSGSVSINTPSGGGSQLIYDSGYNVVRSGLGWGSTAGASFSASLSGVTVVTGTNYPAISGSGSGSVTVPTPSAPSAPGISVAALGNGYVDFNYSAPGYGGDGGVSYYQYSSDNSSWINNPANPFRINGTNGTTVYGYVRAVNAYGQAGPSAGASGVPRTVPSAPTSFTANNATFGELALSWAAPSSNGGATITGYTLTRTSPGTSTTLLTNANQTTFTDTSLLPYTDYTYVVAAVNAAGTGTSASITQKTLGGIAKIWNGTAYVTVLPKVWNGTTWVDAQAQMWNGTEWKYGI